jgi:hypothetical protein
MLFAQADPVDSTVFRLVGPFPDRELSGNNFEGVQPRLELAEK